MTMLRRPLSVCMAVYNGELFILQQISSILPQLAEDDEVIIVDDCSSDKSISFIESFGDSRIKVVRNRVNKGVVRSFELAIKLARKEVIVLCDQDDVWFSEKLNRLSAALMASPSSVVVSDCIVVDEQGAVLASSFFALRGSKPGLVANLLRNSYLGCAMAFDARIKSVVLPFPKNIRMHDEWIGLVGELAGGVQFLPEPLFSYRRHAANVTKLQWGGLWFALRKRFHHAFALLQRWPAILAFRKSHLIHQSTK